MRLLFVTHTLPLPGQALSNVGGMQRVAAEQLAALRRLPDVELSVLTLESASRWTGVLTVPFLLRLLREIPRRVRKEGIEAVLFSSMVTASVAVPLRRRLQRAGVALGAIPLGLDVTLPNPAYQRFVPKVFGALDVLFPISRATADECIARGADPARIQVVPCGAEPDRFPAVEDRSATRRALLEELIRAGEPPIPPEALLLLSIGRHQERKGFHWFVSEVMPLLPADVVYLLGGSGPMTPTIRDAVRRHGLTDRVRVLGRVTESMLAALYRGADLFIMPNIPVAGDMEGFGVVMLEAGLSGLPVLASDLEGIRDVVHPGQNGSLLPSSQPEPWIAAVADARESLAAREKAAARARSFTLDHFGWDSIAGRLASGLAEARASKSVSK
jgi:phosphatidylinositol alpha-1,6-mannosyltransferase